MKLLYIAGRFNGSVEQNCRKVEDLACTLVRMFPDRVQPVVPHSLGRVLYGVQGEEAAYAGTLELLRRCDAVLLAIGWDKSKGARAEKAEAERLGKPVFYEADLFDPFSLVESWLRGEG